MVRGLTSTTAALGLGLLLPALAVGALVTLRVIADFADDPEWAGWRVPARVDITGIAVALFTVAGVAWLVGLAAIPQGRRNAAWPSRQGAAVQIVLAVAVIVLLYFTLGQISALAWEALRLPPQRLWRAAVLALMAFPFLLALQVVVNGYTARSRAKGLALEFGFVVAIALVLVVAVAHWADELGLVPVLLPALPIVMCAFAAFGAWARGFLCTPTLFLVLTQAMMIGWVLGAISPLVQ